MPVFAVAALDKQNVADRRELVTAARFDEQAAVGGLPLGLLQVEHIAQAVDQRLQRQRVKGAAAGSRRTGCEMPGKPQSAVSA